MVARSELFATKALGTKLSLTTCDGVAAIGITNMVSRTGVAMPISKEEAMQLGRALVAFARPDPEACATCGAPATSRIRRLWQAEVESACTACAARIAHVSPSLPVGRRAP